jgi:hypothetical protein
MLTALLVAALAPAAQAQSEAGHVYQVIEWRGLPGMEDAYSQSYHDYLRPIWSEVVRRGGMVGYVDLTKLEGDQTPGTHLLLLEWEDQESLDNWGEAVDEAARSVTGRSWADISENVFLPLRGPDQVRAEIYTAPPGG